MRFPEVLRQQAEINEQLTATLASLVNLARQHRDEYRGSDPLVMNLLDASLKRTQEAHRAAVANMVASRAELESRLREMD